MSAREVQITARRAGTGKVLSFNLPVALSAALPDGGHVFGASFTDEGIFLRYIGPAKSSMGTRGVVFDAPKWVRAEDES